MYYIYYIYLIFKHAEVKTDLNQKFDKIGIYHFTTTTIAYAKLDKKTFSTSVYHALTMKKLKKKNWALFKVYSFYTLFDMPRQHELIG